MKHYLKKVVLFLTDPYVLASCMLLIQRCNEAGIKTEVFMAEELEEQLDIYRPQALYISDDSNCVEALLEEGLVTLCYYHGLNREKSFANCRYAMENPQDIEAEYLERVFRRYMDIPWDILETKRCMLRETTVEDVESFWEIYEEKSITQYTESLYPTIEEEKRYIREYIQNIYHFYEFGVWTVLDKTTEEIVGRVGLSMRDEYEIPELGYVIGRLHQRKGYAYEVCKAVLEYAVNYLGYKQVGAVVHKENCASIELLKKLEFTYEKKHDNNMDYYVRNL